MGFLVDSLYPVIMGNEYAYKPLDLSQLGILFAFAYGLIPLYLTPLP